MPSKKKKASVAKKVARTKHVNAFIGEAQKHFTHFGHQITQHGNISSTSDGFGVFVPAKHSEEFINYLEKRKLDFSFETENNVFTVMYVGELVYIDLLEDKSEKRLANACIKEREKVLRALANHNYLQIWGKSKGVFTVTSAKNFSKDLKLVFTVKNNKTALNQIKGVVTHKYIEKFKLQASVSMIIDGDSKFELVFKKEFLLPVEDIAPTQSNTETVNEIHIENKKEEKAISAELAKIQGANALEDIRVIKNRLLVAENEFISSSFERLVEVFIMKMKKSNFKLAEPLFMEDDEFQISSISPEKFRTWCMEQILPDFLVVNVVEEIK